MILVYPQLAADFSTGGIPLSPVSCIVSEEANGAYECEIEQNRDASGRWQYLVPGAVIRCPAPPKRTPLYTMISGMADIYTAVGTAYKTLVNYPIMDENGDIISSHYLYVWRNHTVPLYTEASSTSNVIKQLAHGAHLIYVETSGSYYRVITTDDVTGYVLASKTAFYGTEEVEAHATVDGGSVNDEQYFRIYKIEKTSPNMVKAYARHVFYDCAATKILKLEATSTTPSSLLASINANGITFHTSVTTGVTKTWDNQTPVEIALDMCEQLDCQLIRDRFDAYLLPAGTTESNPVLAVGKNVVSMTYEENIENIITRYTPVIEGAAGTPTDSTHIAEYPLVVNEYITVDSQGEGDTQAAANFAEGVDLPEITLDIEFAQSEPITLALFDLVQAKDTRLGIDVTAQVTAIEYDAIRKRMNAVTIGNARRRLTGTLYTRPSGTWQHST